MQKIKHIHLHAKPIQRSKKHSSTAAAAYCAGEKIIDKRTGVVNDYTQKNGVGENWIVGFEGSRSELWNLAETTETRRDSTTAKSFDVALPIELSLTDRVTLAKKYSRWLHQQHGCAVDVCIHNLNSSNPHAHILMTTRSIGADGTMSQDKISREWSDAKRKKHGLPGRKTELENDRLMWADASNYMLRRAGITDVKYDQKSYERQGSKKKPTKHHGSYDSLHSRLIKQYNQSVEAFNKTIDEIDALKWQIKNLPPEPDIALTRPDLHRPATDPAPVAQSQMPEPVISPEITRALREMRYQIDRVSDAAPDSNLFDTEILDRDSKSWNERGREIYDKLTGRKRESEPEKKPTPKNNRGRDREM